jgi:hypothetical protein
MSSQTDIHVQEVLQRAGEELRQLKRDRLQITRQIGTVKHTVVGLAALFGEGVLDDDLLELVDRKRKSRRPGLTEACRKSLMEASQAMTALDIYDQIQKTMPLLLSGHKYPMAAVSTILARLVSYGEASEVTGDRGRRAWQWLAR